MADGCPEKIDLAFLRWIWNYPRRTRPKTLVMLEQAREAGKTVYHLRSQREVRVFVESLRRKRTAITA